MARRYEQKRRAQNQEQTRRRIVEAAVELHRTKGPAQTTVSDVARLAGVQRHTVYRHFPQERELFLACSGLWGERHPYPDPAGWRAIADPGVRLRQALAELYRYFEECEDMLARVLRDAEDDELTRETFRLRGGRPLAEIRAALAEPLPADARTRAMLDLALDFHAWQRLARSGLSAGEAADAMAGAILCR